MDQDGLPSTIAAFSEPMTPATPSIPPLYCLVLEKRASSFSFTDTQRGYLVARINIGQKSEKLLNTVAVTKGCGVQEELMVSASICLKPPISQQRATDCFVYLPKSSQVREPPSGSSVLALKEETIIS